MLRLSETKFCPTKGSLYQHVYKILEYMLKFNELGVHLVHLLTLAKIKLAAVT